MCAIKGLSILASKLEIRTRGIVFIPFYPLYRSLFFPPQGWLRLMTMKKTTLSFSLFYMFCIISAKHGAASHGQLFSFCVQMSAFQADFSSGTIPCQKNFKTINESAALSSKVFIYICCISFVGSSFPTRISSVSSNQEVFSSTGRKR
jgi:hypothetical protein